MVSIVLLLWINLVFGVQAVSARDKKVYLSIYVEEDYTIEELENLLRQDIAFAEQVIVLNRLARLHRFTEPVKGMEYAAKALSLKEHTGGNLDIAESYNIIANIYFDQGKYSEALDNYSYSMEICAAFDDYARVAHNFNDIGYVYYKQGIYELAIRNFQRAAKAFVVEESNADLSVTYNNLGQTYAAMGNYVLAEDYFLKGLNIRNDYGDSILIAHSYAYLGLLNQEMGNLEKALEIFDFCIGVYSRYDDIWLLGHTYKYIGDLYSEEGFYDQALKHYNKSLVLFKEFNSRRDIADMLVSIGDAKFRDNQLIEAIAYVRNALNIASDYGFLTTKKSAYYLLSEIYLNAGEDNRSMAFYKKYAQIKDSIFSRTFSNTIAETEMKQISYHFDEEIKVLEKENRMENLVVFFAVIISVLLFILSFLFYWWNRNQKRANTLLNERSIILNKTLKNLAISEEKYKSLFSKANDAIFLMDADTFIDCNIKTLEIFNCEREEIVGHSPQDFSPEYQPDGKLSSEKARELIHQVLEGTPKRFYWLHKKKGGALFDAEVSLSLVNLEEKKYLLAVVRDITEQKKIETELIIAREIAEKATKSKTDFLAKMSHEIRTPLGGIISTSELCSKTELDKNQKELLGIIQTSANNLLGIVNEVLDLSKIESGRFELDIRNFSIRTLVNEVLGMHRIVADEKGLRLTANISPNVPENLKGDDFRLKQVISNLVSNALKFTKKGEVRIKVFTISETKGNYKIKVEISDTGIGISEENLDRLFKEYSQVNSGISREFGGTGLGLTISKGIISKMGGKIGVESTENRGSTFWFIVDFQEGENVVQAKSMTGGKNPAIVMKKSPGLNNKAAKGKLSILLAEDNPINQKVTQINLKSLGHDVEIAENGKIAVEKYIANHYDIILMDIQMPEMDGMEATLKIREYENDNPDKGKVRIIALTANVMSQEAETCYKIGMDDFISKPFKPEDLKKAIEGD